MVSPWSKKWACWGRTSWWTVCPNCWVPGSPIQATVLGLWKAHVPRGFANHSGTDWKQGGLWKHVSGPEIRLSKRPHLSRIVCAPGFLISRMGDDVWHILQIFTFQNIIVLISVPNKPVRFRTTTLAKLQLSCSPVLAQYPSINIPKNQQKQLLYHMIYHDRSP